MSKITAMVPSWCSFKATIDKPDNWDKMTLKEKKIYFAENMDNSVSLCHQCSDEISSDFEFDETGYYNSEFWDESDFGEE